MDSDFFAMDDESDVFFDEQTAINDSDDALLPTESEDESSHLRVAHQRGNSLIHSDRTARQEKKRQHATVDEQNDDPYADETSSDLGGDVDENSSDPGGDVDEGNEKEDSEVWWTTTTKSLWDFVQQHIW